MAEVVVPVPVPIAVKVKPKRSSKRITVFGNRFYLKQLRAARFKKSWTLMGMLDWDDEIDGLVGLRDNQRKAVSAFIKAGHATAKMALADRMAVMKTALAGKGRWGGRVRKVYPRVSPEALAAKVEAVKALI